MSFILCKRGYLAAAPWVFGQLYLPSHYKQMIDDTFSLSMIAKLEPGFLYAFNSILDSYEKKDTEILQQCLEGNLFSHVQKGFSKLSKENIEFKRLHKDDPMIIPLSLNLFSGASCNRSENKSNTQVELISLYKILFQIIEFTIKKTNGKDYYYHAFNVLKNSKLFFQNNEIYNIAISIEVAFTGKNFLSLMKNGENLIENYPGNCFHIFKFESELIRYSDPMSIGDILTLIRKILKLNFSEILTTSWIISDIDNQLEGNPLVRV